MTTLIAIINNNILIVCCVVQVWLLLVAVSFAFTTCAPTNTDEETLQSSEFFRTFGWRPYYWGYPGFIGYPGYGFGCGPLCWASLGPYGALG